MLSITEFIIAMHLLASYRTGSLRALPQTLPPGLYEAAARRGAPQRPQPGSRPTSDVPPISAIPRQFSGAGPPRTSSPLARPPYGTPTASALSTTVAPQTTGDWAITPQEKAQFDAIYTKVDTENLGFITGEQAVGFFSNSRLPEDDLAQIWDLADVNSEGRLNRDEFAVAMHLIRQELNRKGGPSTLPQTLPTNLIPPSMRRQPIAPPHSTAPTFDNAANITKPKSAVEDLFGLDALSSPPPQVAQSTGGSSALTPASPQPTALPQQPRQPQLSSIFKAFVPSSLFGQSLMTPQATGASAGSGPTQQIRGLSQQQQAPAEDDLLGDNDPEISKRLTNETTELANLSNQIGNLTNQMQQVKSKRASTEQDLAQVNAQKKDFETRLAQLRSAYEQEVRDVKTLEDRLAMSRNETRKVQQDIAMVQTTHQDLRSQHQQLVIALEADQKENSSLKEKMRQINTEVSELKPKIEKLRSEARQQKGLVAINKKQLSTNEAERDKAMDDLDGASKELGEATRELEETKRSISSTTRAPPSAAVASPAPSSSSQSMNPFFRRTATASSEKGMTQTPFSPQALTSPNHDAFDSFFGPSFGSSHIPSSIQTSSLPPTLFAGESPNQSRQISQASGLFDQPMRSEAADDIPIEPTGSLSSGQKELSNGDLPNPNLPPPPPPQSRQITSSFLPLKDSLQRSGSASSSVKATGPASRFGDDFSIDTPTGRQTPQPFSSDFPDSLERSDTNRTETATTSSPYPQRSSSLSAKESASSSPAVNVEDADNMHGLFGAPSAAPDIPGAFPDDTTPSMHTTTSTLDHTEEPSRSMDLPLDVPPHTENDPFAITTEHSRGPPSTKDDFESAFADFGSTNKTPSNRSGSNFPAVGGFGGPPQPGTHNEFPPIHEIGADEDSDSDSDSDRGFEDDFAPTSSHQQQTAVGQGQQLSQPSYDHAGRSLADAHNPSQIGTIFSNGDREVPSSQIPTLGSTEGSMPSMMDRPDIDRMASERSQLPGPDAQSSPPTYDQIVSPAGHTGEHGGSKQFPAEYGGLLPSREILASPPPVSQSPETNARFLSNGDEGSAIFGGPTAKERAASGSFLPPSQMPMAPGATAAPYAYTAPPPQSVQSQPPVPPKKVADEFDDAFGDLSEAKEADEKGEDEFSDSHRSGFDEFNPTFDSPAPSRFANSVSQPGNDSFYDFESGFSSSPTQTSAFSQASQSQPTTKDHDWDAIFAGLGDTPSKTNGNIQPSVPPKEEMSPSGAASSISKPPLARGLTSGTEHDDPILKVSTALGAWFNVANNYLGYSSDGVLQR